VVGALVEILGETGLRLSEALALCWTHVDLRARRITLELTKSGKVRHVRLTDSAIRAFMSLTRFMHEAHVFVRSDGRPWRDVRGPFHAARKAVGMEWAGFHDLDITAPPSGSSTACRSGKSRHIWDMPTFTRPCDIRILRQTMPGRWRSVLR